MGGGCHSYLLTYELVQTQVDIDMPQMLVMQSNVTVALLPGLSFDCYKYATSVDFVFYHYVFHWRYFHPFKH